MECTNNILFDSAAMQAGRKYVKGVYAYKDALVPTRYTRSCPPKHSTSKLFIDFINFILEAIEKYE
jgi:hypothetical protein